MKLNKHKKNLKIKNNFIYSYNTKVAEIIDKDIIVNKYYSLTTNRHISYVTKEFNLNIIRNYIK